jgi:hypothetical protein
LNICANPNNNTLVGTSWIDEINYIYLPLPGDCPLWRATE